MDLYFVMSEKLHTMLLNNPKVMHLVSGDLRS
jgi:hypothetical protein